MAVLAAGLVFALTGQLAAQDPPVRTSEERLATSFVRFARGLAENSVPTVELLDLITMLAEEAVRLDPDNVDHWRFRRNVAILAEEDIRYDTNVAVDAVIKINELDTFDQSAVLAVIDSTIQKLNSAEERIAAYERRLRPESVEQIGPAVASRLALELARLHYRRGDTAEYAARLAESVALDPSNTEAAALAVGYFRMNVDDAYAEAELLSVLVLADPTHPFNQAALAELLLENGAYAGASRMYRMCARTLFALENNPTNNMIADHAIAQWGMGRANDALLGIRSIQHQLNALVQQRRKAAEPEIDRMELAALEAPLSPTLATVRAAILRQLERPDATEMYERAIYSYDLVIDNARKSEDVAEDEIRELILEKIWVQVWLGNDPALGTALLEEASAAAELTDTARQRFAGWVAFNEGRYDDAIEQLSPLTDDPAATLGVAEAQRALGYSRDAARTYLGLARSKAGTLIGVWSAERLTGILGRRVPLSDDVTALEDLISEIPAMVDRYADDPSTAVQVRVRVLNRTIQPYEPVLVEIDITNNASHPMAISRSGPIKSNLFLQMTGTTVGVQGQVTPPPIVVDISRRLRLEPGERVTIPLDLRVTSFGAAIDQLPATGWTLRGRVMLNPFANPAGAYVPGLLGSVAHTPPFSLDGVRLTTEWASQTLGTMAPGADPDVRLMALLMNLLSEPGRDPDPQVARMLAAGPDRLQNAFDRLEPVDQAWLLMVTRPAEVTIGVEERAAATEDRFVRIAYLLSRVGRPDNAMLDVIRQSSDERVARIAELHQMVLVQLEQQRKQAEAAQAAPAP